MLPSRTIEHSSFTFLSSAFLPDAELPYVIESAPMERAGDLLGRIAKRLNRPEASLAWLVSAWPQIVGQALAAHTRPIRCWQGSLEIIADAKPWQDQLEEMKGDLRSRINQGCGGNMVREVKLTAEKPAGPACSHETDNDHLPFIRRRRG
jgi:predicted nucleic acid-binding Zn ribbon protein